MKKIFNYFVGFLVLMLKILLLGYSLFIFMPVWALLFLLSLPIAISTNSVNLVLSLFYELNPLKDFSLENLREFLTVRVKHE